MATAAGSGGNIDIGNVLSRGFETIGRNFVAFFALSVLLGGVPTVAFSYLAGASMSGENFFSLSGGGMFLAALFVQMLAGGLLQMIIVRTSILTLSGRSPDVAGSVAAAFSLILPLIGLSILTGLMILIGLVLLIVPGIIAWVALIVAVPVMVEERRSIIDCMERSAALTKGSRWRIFLLLVILGVAYLAMAGGLVAASLEMEGTPAQFAADAIIAIVSTLVMSAMTAALYVELRTVKEGATTEGLAAIFE